jgi:hypothetical protein
VGFVKEKTIEVAAKDFLWKRAVCHAEFEHNGSHYLVQAAREEDAENPRREWDHAWTWSTTRGAGYSDEGAIDIDDWEDMEPKEREQYLWHPLALYRHGGDVIYVGDNDHWADPGGWDSGQMGVAHIEKKKALAEWGKEGSVRLTKKIKDASLACLKSEVEEMNMWLQGDVYGVSVIELETEEEESCWGHYCANREELTRAMRELMPLGMTEKQEKAVLEDLEWEW